LRRNGEFDLPETYHSSSK